MDLSEPIALDLTPRAWVYRQWNADGDCLYAGQHPMSRKKTNRAAADALAREAAAEERMALFEYDQRMERQAELDRQANREFLLNVKQELARDRLENVATELAVYDQEPDMTFYTAYDGTGTATTCKAPRGCSRVSAGQTRVDTLTLLSSSVMNVPTQVTTRMARW